MKPIDPSIVTACLEAEKTAEQRIIDERMKREKELEEDAQRGVKQVLAQLPKEIESAPWAEKISIYAHSANARTAEILNEMFGASLWKFNVHRNPPTISADKQQLMDVLRKLKEESAK